MARIRTVKPELWTDPEFTECSMSARVLFIAMLNFASDYGVIPDKPRQIKMQCLPADSIDVEPLLGELIEHDFLVRRVAPTGEKVLVIRTFTQHQKVTRPTEGRWGDPTKWGADSVNDPPETEGESLSDHEDSVSPRGDISEPSPPEGKGRELEGKGSSSSSQHNSHSDPDEPVDDDDDFRQAIERIVDHRCRGRRIDNDRGYRHAVRTEAIRLDGDAVREWLTSGATPAEIVDLLDADAPPGTTGARAAPWCDDTCPTCGTTDTPGWIDTGNGLAPCPERTAA